MNIKPLGDRVVVKLLEKEEVTASGIVLPDTVDTKQKAEGRIVAAGPGKMLDTGKRAEMEIKVGDRVLFEKWGGEEVEVGGEKYKIVSAEKILAILE